MAWTKSPDELGIPVEDLTGVHKGSLTVIERTKRPDGETRYKQKKLWYRCRCDCGKEIIVPPSRIREVEHPSCGCYKPPIKTHQRRIGCGIWPTEKADREERARRRKEEKEQVIRNLNARVCAQCGKEFDCYAGADWGYQIKRQGKNHLFCRYNCMVKWDNEHPRKEIPDVW